MTPQPVLIDLHHIDRDAAGQTRAPKGERKGTERLLAASPALRSRFNHRQVSILRSAVKHPDDPLRIDVHQRTHGVSYQTARADLLDLESLALFTRTKRGNAYEFYPVPDLRKRLDAFAETWR